MKTAYTHWLIICGVLASLFLGYGIRAYRCPVEVVEKTVVVEVPMGALGTQEWLCDNGQPVKKDGKWGPETEAALGRATGDRYMKGRNNGR